MSSKNSYSLNKKGYLIVKVLEPSQCKELSEELIDYIFKIMFDVHYEQVPRDLNILTDKTVRENIFGYNGNDLVWEGGNSRKPIFSKSSGMFEGHYNLKKLEMIDFNPKMYKVASRMMNTNKLVFRSGIEKFSIKPGIPKGMKIDGAQDMGLHIDANLFHPEVNYPYRIQALVCLSSDTNITTRDSGCLRILTNFHHYWEFIGKLLHPITGIISIDDVQGRFHVLPKNFEKEIIPIINMHIENFTLFLYNREIYYLTENRRNTEFYDLLIDQGIRVPNKIRKLEWKELNVAPGRMIFWHQYLPHQSLRNKSSIPRIVCYYSLFPVNEKYYGSEEHKWLLDMISDCKFYYGIDNGKYPRDIRNKHEYNYLVSTEKITEVLEYIKNNKLARKLCGIDPY